MAVLYVDEFGSKLRYSRGLIVVEKDGDRLATVRIQELEQVVVEANSSITSAAMGALLRNSVDVAFVSHNGEYLGKLEPALGKNIALRRAQFAAADDDMFCTAIAKILVSAKLTNMRTILMRYQCADASRELDAPIAALKQACAGLTDVHTVSEIMGVEGTGTRAYFQAFPSVISDPFYFHGRNRRPPQDPVNAMLGFSYALLEHAVERSVSVCGLDPYCGFLHQERYGRQSLVLDLMEEMRPVIADSAVINCCNRKLVSPDTDFEDRDGGVYLNESGRQKFFRAFEMRMRQSVKADTTPPALSYLKLCIGQARKLADCISRHEPDYKPFLVK